MPRNCVESVCVDAPGQPFGHPVTLRAETFAVSSTRQVGAWRSLLLGFLVIVPLLYLAMYFGWAEDLRRHPRARCEPVLVLHMSRFRGAFPDHRSPPVSQPSTAKTARPDAVADRHRRRIDRSRLIEASSLTRRLSPLAARHARVLLLGPQLAVRAQEPHAAVPTAGSPGRRRAAALRSASSKATTLACPCHVANARIRHYTAAVEQDDLATYRAMRPEERLALALELSALCWALLDVPDRKAGDRKWAAWQREHDLSNEALLAGLERHRRESESE